MSSSPLSPNHQRTLDLFRVRHFFTKAQLEVLMSKYLNENGVETALRRMVARGYIAKNIRFAYTPSQEKGPDAKRRVYVPTLLGMQTLGLSEKVREAFNRHYEKAGGDHGDLTHEMGISHAFTALQAGHYGGLWDCAWTEGRGTAIKSEFGQRTPDGVPVINGRDRYFFEMEYGNRPRKMLEAADRYWSAYEDGRIDGRLWYMTRSGGKMRAIRSALQKHFQDRDVDPSFFLFTDWDMVPLDRPEVLLERTCFTLSDKRVPLIPSRKAEEQIA
jgi:hypothetical protein